MGWAAGYFPTLSRSIIAAAGLNFSVRDGKRCAPARCRRAVVRSIGRREGRFAEEGGGPQGKVPAGRPGRGTARAAPPAAPATGGGARRKRSGPLVPLGSTRRRAHTCGLSTWSSPTALEGGLISGTASRLDAFSAYPLRTRLPGRAPGGATGSP